MSGFGREGVEEMEEGEGGMREGGLRGGGWGWGWVKEGSEGLLLPWEHGGSREGDGEGEGGVDGGGVDDVGWESCFRALRFFGASFDESGAGGGVWGALWKEWSFSQLTRPTEVAQSISRMIFERRGGCF